MYKYISKVRGPVLFALVFAVTAFILSLLVLLAGSTPNFLLDAYIVLYDTSSLAANQSSNTAIIYDWYSFYYLSLCYGSWGANNTTSGRAQTNISCSHQPAGYRISINKYLLDGGATLVDNDSYKVRELDPAASFATWLTGVVLAGIASALLPTLLQGKIHMNGYAVFILILANIALLTGAILTTLDGMGLAETEAQCSNVCLGLMWATVACTFFALVGEFFEWNIQRFTPKGERVNLRWRSGDVPWVGHERSNSLRRWRVWA